MFCKSETFGGRPTRRAIRDLGTLVTYTWVFDLEVFKAILW